MTDYAELIAEESGAVALRALSHEVIRGRELAAVGQQIYAEYVLQGGHRIAVLRVTSGLGPTYEESCFSGELRKILTFIRIGRSAKSNLRFS